MGGENTGEETIISAYLPPIAPKTDEKDDATWFAIGELSDRLDEAEKQIRSLKSSNSRLSFDMTSLRRGKVS